MKHLKTIFACLLMAVLSIGQMWADDVIVTITRSSVTSTGNFAYGNDYDWSQGEIAGKCQITANNSELQFNGGKPNGTEGTGSGKVTKSRRLWNTTATPRRIKSITLTTGSGTARNWKVFCGTSAATSTSGTDYGTQIGSEQAPSTDGTTWTIPDNTDYTYFMIYETATSASFLSSVVVTYEGESSTCSTPTFTPDGGNFVGTQSVTLTQADSKAIYYTTNGNDPTTAGTLYSAPFDLTETTTVKAAAKDGDAWSSVVEKTFTKLEPLTTMDAIFAAATAADKTATTVAITFDSWVVTGVATNGKNAYLTDDDYKGLIIYDASGSNTNPVCGLAEGDVLSGTAICKVQLYNYAAQLTTLNASDLTIVHNGEIPLHEVAAADVTSLDGHNVGSLIKVNGKFTYDNSKYYINGLQLYNSLCSYTNPNTTNDYNCTGVFIIYKPYSGDDVPEICPRKSGDIEMITSKTLSEITLGGTYPTEFEQDDAFSHAGMTVTAHYSDESTTDVTEFATFTGYNMANTGEQTVTVHYSENTTEVTTTYTITVNEPTPTGDFEELDGELVAGDYLIYDGGSLMLAEISSNRFAYEEKEPDANGIISNPSQYAVWTLAKSGDYWTFYNSKAGKYAAGTGASGKAQLLDGDSDDKAKWAIDDDLVVTNKYNADNNVNATLRHNYSGTSNYGFACYSATQGGKPVFYKVATPSYYISETLTGCSAADGNPTKVPQTLTEDVELKYNLTTGYVWPDAITVTVGGVALDPNESDYLWDNTKAPAELTIAKEKVNGNIVVTITAIEKALDNITIDLAPNKVTYETGEFFNPAGLRIQLNYTAGASDVVEYSNLTAGDFTFSPDLETALAPENTVVEITYGGKSVNQAITVTDPVPEAKTVVIIAEFDSKLYAMSNVVDGNQCEAIEVTKNGDNLVVASAEEKAAVQWYMSKLGTTVNLQKADENGKYLSGNSSNASFAESDDKVDLTMTQAEGKYIISAGGTRAIMYRNTGVFKHYSTGSSASEYAKVSEIFEVAEGATNIVISSKINPELAYTPASDEITVGDAWSAPSLGYVEGFDGLASISYESSNEAVATVTEGVIALAGGTGTATITATFGGNTNYLAGSATYTITVNAPAPVPTGTTYTKVTSTENITDGEYLIVYEGDATHAAMAFNGSLDNIDQSMVGVAVTINEGVIAGTTAIDAATFTIDVTAGTLQSASGYYIGRETYDNGMDKSTETAYTNTFAISEGNAVITGAGNCTLRYNYSSDQLRFRYYKSGQQAIQLYKKDTPTPPTPTPDYTRDVTVGNYGTICLPNGGTISGAKLYDLEYYDGASTLYLLEVNGNAMEAGRPYIFLPSVATIEVFYTDEENATAGSLHGLVGSYSTKTIMANDGNYILLDNEYWFVNSLAYVGANRAYIHMEDAPNAPSQQQGAPRRRIAMAVNGTQTATGIEDLNASEKPMKMMINGQIFILRGEKMYDTTGRLVK